MNSKYLPLLATIVIFVLAYAVCALQFPNMLSTRVIGNLLTDNAFLGIAAVGMTFVIISGGIDLSIGSVIAFTGVFLAVILHEHLDPSAARLRASRSSITTAFGALHGRDHPLSRDAGLHRHAGRHVPRTRHGLRALDRLHPDRSRLLFAR